MKINIYHIDTCLPDFFGGHHLAHLQVPVDRDTSTSDLQQMLTEELYQGAVSGSDIVAMALSSLPIPRNLTSEEADEVGFLYSQQIGSTTVTVLHIEVNEKAWKDYTDEVYKAAVKAIEEMTSHSEYPFRDLDPADCDAEQVYAYFVLEMGDE